MKLESVHNSQYSAMTSAAVIEFHTYIVEALLSTFRKLTMYVKIKTLFKLFYSVHVLAHGTEKANE